MNILKLDYKMRDFIFGNAYVQIKNMDDLNVFIKEFAHSDYFHLEFDDDFVNYINANFSFPLFIRNKNGNLTYTEHQNDHSIPIIFYTPNYMYSIMSLLNVEPYQRFHVTGYNNLFFFDNQGVVVNDGSNKHDSHVLVKLLTGESTLQIDNK